ncbi:MAG: hypothetical protein ACPGID_05160 [Rubricella sp.]
MAGDRITLQTLVLTSYRLVWRSLPHAILALVPIVLFLLLSGAAGSVFEGGALPLWAMLISLFVFPPVFALSISFLRAGQMRIARDEARGIGRAFSQSFDRLAHTTVLSILVTLLPMALLIAILWLGAWMTSGRHILFLFLIAAVFWFTWTAAAGPFTLENTRAIASIRKSAELIRPVFWKVMATIGLTVLPINVAMLLMSEWVQPLLYRSLEATAGLSNETVIAFSITQILLTWLYYAVFFSTLVAPGVAAWSTLTGKPDELADVFS